MTFLALIFSFSTTNSLAADPLKPLLQIFAKHDSTPKNVGQLKEIEKEFRQVAAKAVKSVVGIQIGPSRGSGIIVSSDGLILTAAHVVKKPGTKAIVTTADGKTYKAVALGVYLGADAGMMKITDPGKWPACPVAPKRSLHVGDWCLALGHPLGYTEGRPPVVRVGRIISLEQRTIQTDCALIVGDSGGPLMNLKGQVIGINSRISGALSMNYHVPIDIFHKFWKPLKQGKALIDKTLRDTESVKKTFQSVIADTAKCVVRVRCGKKEICLGTIVGPDGWILTKASELKKGRIIVRLPDGRDLEARILGINRQYDLAMLKVDALELPKIKWELKDPEVGQWVAVPGLEKDPIAIGVISVPRRAIPLIKGSLGVILKPDAKKPMIILVFPKSPAAKAGLKKNDVITHVNGNKIKDREALTKRMKRYRPGTTIRLGILRDDKKLTIPVTLGKIVTAATQKRDELNATGVGVSKRHDDFPVVLQHDATLRPTDCGSPLVTLNGKAVGINIARGGRTETYCIPANTLVSLMYELMSGHLRPEPKVTDSSDDEESEPTADEDDSTQPIDPEKIKPKQPAKPDLKKHARPKAEKSRAKPKTSKERSKAKAKPKAKETHKSSPKKRSVDESKKPKVYKPAKAENPAPKEKAKEKVDPVKKSEPKGEAPAQPKEEKPADKPAK